MSNVLDTIVHHESISSPSQDTQWQVFAKAQCDVTISCCLFGEDRRSWTWLDHVGNISGSIFPHGKRQQYKSNPMDTFWTRTRTSMRCPRSSSIHQRVRLARSMSSIYQAKESTPIRYPLDSVISPYTCDVCWSSTKDDHRWETIRWTCKEMSIFSCSVF